MQKSFFLVTVLASTLTLAASTVALAKSNPAALLTKLVEAINRGDAAATLALYADDAVFDVPGGLCAAAPCVGKDTIHTDTLSCKPFHFLLPLPSEGDLSHFRRRVGAEAMEATITVLVGLFRTFGLIKGELLATDGQLEPSNSRYKGSSYAYHSP